MTRAIQERIQSLIQANAGFVSSSVTLGDFRVMDSGEPPYAVIVPGPVSMTGMDWARKRFTWTYYVYVIVPFQGDDYTKFNEAREAIFDSIHPYPTLNGYVNPDGFRVSHAMLSEGDDLEFYYPKGGSDHPQFVRQRWALTIIQDQTYDNSGEFTT
jgi:hypothetical protein